MMKPILFNAEMVRAILDGRKTVTRRVVKPQPEMHMFGDREALAWIPPAIIKGYLAVGVQYTEYLKRPYNVGDILYVRETWRPHSAWSGSYSSGCEIEYKAGGENLIIDGSVIAVPERETPWRPSIHMPREAARIFLRVTDVRVERLQDSFGKHGSTIFEIRSEGINIPEDCRECIDTYGSPCCIDTTEDDGSECGMLDDPRSDFADLWDSTIKPADRERYGWAANPWVWVIEFERCEKPKEAVDGSV